MFVFLFGWWIFEQSKLIWLCRANVAANIGLHMSRVGYLGNNQLSVPSIQPPHPPPTIHPSLWPLLPAVALLNNAITPPLNTPDCHFPHKQCWSIWSQTMPWASVSYWGQTGTKSSRQQFTGRLQSANLNGQHLNYPPPTSATPSTPAQQLWRVMGNSNILHSQISK